MKNKLIEKRNALFDEAKAFLIANSGEDGCLSSEDAEKYEKMEQGIVNLNNEIERYEKLERMEAMLKSPKSDPILTQPTANGNKEKGSILASTEYREAFMDSLRTGFRQVSNILQEGVDSDGGYLVPEELDKKILDKLNDKNIMRGLANHITTTGLRKFNLGETKPTAYWVEEGQKVTFSDVTFSQKSIDAHKMMVGVKVTNELLQDEGFNLESYIANAFAIAMAEKEEAAFLTGDGSGKPWGIFDKTAGGTVAGNVATLKSDSLIDLVYELRAVYRKKACFIMNDKTLKAIRKFKDTNGQYLWQPSLQGGEPDRVLGYSVHTSPFVPENSIAFGDFSYYTIADRGSRSFKTLSELYAENDMTGFLGRERVDGLLTLKETVQILTIGTAAEETTGTGESSK